MHVLVGVHVDLGAFAPHFARLRDMLDGQLEQLVAVAEPVLASVVLAALQLDKQCPQSPRRGELHHSLLHQLVGLIDQVGVEQQ